MAIDGVKIIDSDDGHDNRISFGLYKAFTSGQT